MQARNGVPMKIGNISYNTSFGETFKVYGTKKDMSQLRLLISAEKSDSKNPAMVYNLSNHYATTTKQPDKQEFCIVVTGEESLKETNNLSGGRLSSFLFTTADKIIHLSSQVKKDAEEILEAIKNNQ